MSALDELDRYLKERNRISKREGEPTTRILNVSLKIYVYYILNKTSMEETT